MRARGLNYQQILLGLALLAALCWNLAHASEIKGLQLTTGATGTRVEVRLDAQAEFKVLSLSNPDRLVIDLPDSRFQPGLKPPVAAGIVKAVRSGQPVPGTARLVFDLAGPVVALKPRYESGPDGVVRLVVEWPGDGSDDPIARIAAATQSPPPAPVVVAETTPEASSAEATSRVIAGLQAAGATQPNPASPPQPQPTGDPTLPRQVPSTIPAQAAASTRDATGAPPVDEVLPATAQATPAPPPQRALQAGSRPLVIAIDAGHGGQDPGAIGPAGTYEKHIVLAIARELARQINATPGMRAYLVRDQDAYIELPQRARRARQARADMFVSIHADAALNRSAYGSSVYTLSTRGASSQQARWLADTENASDLVGGVRLEKDTLSNVLLDLAQSGHMKASQDAARHVLDGLRGVGKAHKAHVEYANFSVLRNADMPAMLVETGFISNVDEEKRLKDPAHQRRLAAAVLKGINEFFVSQPPPGTLYAARAGLGTASAGGR